MLVKMKIDRSEIIKNAKEKPKRSSSAIYLEQELFKEFKTDCKANGVSASKVLEELMRQFLANKKKK